MEENDIASVWEPSEGLRATSLLSRFIEALNDRGVVSSSSYEELHRWSVESPQLFWQELYRFVGVIGEGESVPAYASADTPLTPLWRSWFPNVQLNFAENLLHGNGSDIALVSWSEGILRRSLSRQELRERVISVATSLREKGVRPSSRVFAYVPHIPEATVCMLASASLGAMWSSCGTDYKLDGILSRMEQVEPEVFVAVRRYVWRGEWVDVSDVVGEIVNRVKSIKTVVLIDYCEEVDGIDEIVFDRDISILSYSDICKQRSGGDTWQFERFPFMHPLYVMFSSGTTGKPKAIVHGAGGTLLEHKKEMMLHGDVRPGDKVFYQTSTSWMMWNWVVSALACEATVVMYDGDPMVEGGSILWRLAEEQGVTHFGTSAAYLGVLEKMGIRPRAFGEFSSLRALFSTGSTLYPQQFDYISEAIKPLWIQSISGGTDIIGCFGLGCPLKPVIRGEVQAKSLGYDVQVYNGDGKRVVGEEGELVCALPAPSMPVRFLGDPDGALYRKAYFEDFEGVWRHGDFLRETDNGGLVFLGRSDATLKPAGVRVATADIYSGLSGISVIKESLAVGYTPCGDSYERLVLFVVLAEGALLDDGLRGTITETLRKRNAFYVPAVIMQAPQIPKTANGKVSELTVKRLLRGDDPGNRSALADPQCLAFFEVDAKAYIQAKLG